MSEGQAITVRVAVGNFWDYLSSNSLGDDEHGIAMRKAYQDRIKEIFQLMGLQ